MDRSSYRCMFILSRYKLISFNFFVILLSISLLLEFMVNDDEIVEGDFFLNCCSLCLLIELLEDDSRVVAF